MNAHRQRRLVALVMGALLAVTFWRSRPPSPEAADGPSEQFSAGRAVQQLTAVLGDAGPHPVGTPDNAEVRRRIERRLTELGWAVRTHRHVGCSPRGICSEHHDLVAVREAGPDVLLLAAHHDSVGAGVGAADDGAAVGALLEIARLIREQPDPPRNTIAILLTDGEEAGLLGAKSFVHREPLWKRVRAVVNLEARGTTGPSLMFETGGKTAALVEHLDALDRPHSSSLFAAVYELLPNDTDFSVFRGAGAAGFNFAFIDGVARYHTALDDLDHLDHGSVQHHGDNVWALARSLGDADLGALHRGDDAVWFDVLGLGLVSWPQRHTLPLSCIVLALLVYGAWTYRRRRGRSWRELGRALGVALLTPVVAALLGALVGLVVALPSSSTMPRMSATLVPFVALVSASAATALALSGLVSRVDRWLRFYGLWLIWAALGVAVAVLFPAGSYLFVAPGLLAALMGLFAWRGGTPIAAATMIPAASATVLWGSVAIGLVSALGLAAPFAIAAALGLLISTATPLLIAEGEAPPKRSVVGLGAFALCLSVAAGIVSPYDEVEPQRMSIVHAQVDGASEWWIDRTWGAVPDAILLAIPDYEEVEAPLPLVGLRRAVVANAPSLALPAPEVETLAAGGGSLRLRITSPRGAAATGILFPPDLALPMVKVAGAPLVPPALESGRWRGHRVCLCLSSQPHGCVFELPSLPSGTPLRVFDMARGAPSVAQTLLDARAAAHGTPSQDGDLSLVSTGWPIPSRPRPGDTAPE